MSNELLDNLPTDIIEYIFTFFTLDELHKIGPYVLGKKDYKYYWNKYQYLNWKNVYIHTPVPYEFVSTPTTPTTDNSDMVEYIASTNLLKGPAIIESKYNSSLLNFIYKYYWKPEFKIYLGYGKTNYITIPECSHIMRTNPFMYDTIICLIKYLPYKKHRFQKFLECRDKLSKHINDFVSNITIIYSYKQIKTGISRVMVGKIQDILIESKSEVVDLEEKITHIIDTIDGAKSVDTFSWSCYNKYPKLLIPMLDNLEEDVNREMDNISLHVRDNNRYHILIKHFHPYISNSALKRSIEQIFGLFMLSFEDMLLDTMGPGFNNMIPEHMNLFLNGMFNIGKIRLETVLEVLPDKYGLLAFGDINSINEYGILLSLYILRSKFLSTFHSKILIRLCFTYFDMWLKNSSLYPEKDQQSLLKCIQLMGDYNYFKWDPNYYYEYVLDNNNDMLIKYIVDRIDNISKDHCSIANEYPISRKMNDYIFTKYSYHKYSKGLDITNAILIICIVIFVICIALLKSGNKRVIKNKETIRIMSKVC